MLTPEGGDPFTDVETCGVMSTVARLQPTDLARERVANTAVVPRVTRRLLPWRRRPDDIGY